MKKYQQDWWCLPLFSTLGKERQVFSEFKASPIYRLSSKPGLHNEILSWGGGGDETFEKVDEVHSAPKWYPEPSPHTLSFLLLHRSKG